MSSAASAVEETAYTNDNTKRKRRRRRSNAARRRRQRQRRSRPRLSLHRTRSRRNENYDEYYESPLRERWVDVISSSSSSTRTTTAANNANVRPLNRDEWRYLYETEILVDKLLGWHDDDDDDDDDDHDDVSSLCEEYNRQNNNDKTTTTTHRLLVSNRGSELFVANAMIISIVTVSSVMVVLVRKFFVSTRIIQDMVSSISTFITLQQSSNSIIPSSISAMQTTLRGYALHIRALWGSRSYLLRHFDRVRLVPLLLRLLRKCIILEAWRHIWVMSYKVTIKVHKSVTVQNVKLLYTKVCPGWIRRGLRNMCQGMIQSHITGAVGGLIVMGGGGGGGGSTTTTIDSIIWPSSTVSGDGGGNGDGSSISSTIDDIFTATTTTNMLEDSSSSVVDECVNAIQQSVVISEVIDSVAEEVLAESI